MMNAICKKLYIELTPPAPGDATADRDRLMRALRERLGEVNLSQETFRRYYLLLRDFDWRLTVTLVNTGRAWEVVRLERGDTSAKCCGLAADLGSSTVIMRLLDLNSGEVLGEESVFNPQIKFGDEILSRIFYVKDSPERLREMQSLTVAAFNRLISALCEGAGVSAEDCGALSVAGNTTMIHLLLGFDPWHVFHTPYAPAFNSAGFTPARELGLDFPGLVYCFPSVSNYVGGDIVSGLLASGMHKKHELALFMDIGTNGEMLLGSDEFLLSTAGAAGPALEGGISRQGMQAKPGAIDTVKIRGGELTYTTIGNEKPLGICGSGIVDLLAEMLLEGWIDSAGSFQPEKSPRIVEREGEYAVAYAWSGESGSGDELLFTQRDISGYMNTKAAANTMVSFLLDASGAKAGDIKRLYLAGAFGTHLNIESAITIGLYPDMPRDRFVILGNGSLLGAQRLLTDAELCGEAESAIERIDYLPLSEETDFLTKMYAAKFLPHTDITLYPSVAAEMKRRRGK